MKKSLILLVVFLCLAAVASAETKFSMELWNRWTYHMTDGEVDQNEMNLSRGYFRIEPVFTPNIKGRFNLDFFSDEGMSNGAGIKLKYAYLDFSNILWEDANLTVGLMKTYFGTIYDWEYVTIEKDPSDKYKFVASTDYGLGISGYLPQGFGTYAFAAYNGEGYKKTGEHLNTAMNFCADVRLTPMAGLTVGGSYYMMNKNNDKIDDVDNPDRIEYNMMAGVARITLIPNVDIWAQYLTRETDKPHMDDYEAVTDQAISIIPIISLQEFTGKDLELVFRYDMYDNNTDVDNDVAGSGAYNTTIAGVNYYMMRDEKNSPKLWLQVNYSMKDKLDEDADDSSSIEAQLRWKFSENL
ncbi:MAG: OprO/OprP family phosphate-selective porin [Candidatus Cloacimonetes bacterium]|nr:OprO/OprP family phosphate-selective porin [Candidatus Cloacimonadota bacterium]